MHITCLRDRRKEFYSFHIFSSLTNRFLLVLPLLILLSFYLLLCFSGVCSTSNTYRFSFFRFFSAYSTRIYKIVSICVCDKAERKSILYFLLCYHYLSFSLSIHDFSYFIYGLQISMSLNILVFWCAIYSVEWIFIQIDLQQYHFTIA